MRNPVSCVSDRGNDEIDVEITAYMYMLVCTGIHSVGVWLLVLTMILVHLVGNINTSRPQQTALGCPWF